MRYTSVLLGTTLAAAITYFALALALFPARIKAEYWVREMLVIKRNIVKQYAGRKKIIIASGSNSLFSIDTNQLTKEFHIPVINYGLHAGLPLQVILGEAAKAAERGDTIIMPLESGFYCRDPVEPNSWEVRNTIAWDVDKWEEWSIAKRIRSIVTTDARIVLEMVQARLQERFTPEDIADRLAALDDAKVLARFASEPEPTSFSYSAYHMDSLGNMKQIDGTKDFGAPIPADDRIDVCPPSRQMLASFIADMARRGVEVYFANMPYVATKRIDPSKLKTVSDEFTAEVSTLAPLLDSKSQLVLPRELFFDTYAHLNTKGRKIRTRMLADAIRSNPHLLARIRPE